MSRVSIGNHSALRVARSQQERIRQFFQEVLGCDTTKTTPTMDFFRMGGAFYLTIIYQETALADEDFSKAIWLEIKADDVSAMRQKILAFGIKQVDSLDKTHLYFQAPGGQVFRLVGTNEDLSVYEGSPSSKPGSYASPSRMHE